MAPRSDDAEGAEIRSDPPIPSEFPSLVNVVSENHGGIDLLRELKGKYSEDPMFKAILDKPHDYRNFTVENNLIFLKSGKSKILCIPKVLIDGRSACEIVISEAHSLLAHLGASKTLVWQQGPASFNITAKTDVCTLPINVPKLIIAYVTYYCLKLSNISTLMATGSGQHGKHCSLSTAELCARHNVNIQVTCTVQLP